MGRMLSLMSLSVLWLIVLCFSICRDTKVSLGADDYNDGVGEFVDVGVNAHDGDLGDCLN